MHATIKTEAFVDETTVIIIPEKAPDSVGKACVDLPLNLVVNLKVPDVKADGLEEIVVAHCVIAHRHI